MTTLDPNATIWEGTPQTLTAAATGGKVQSTKYRLTPFTLHIERGLVRTDSQQVPLSGVYDIDVKQSMSQKARGVGDVLVHVRSDVKAEVVILEAIKDPKQVRDLLNQTVAAAKQHYVEQARGQVNIAAPTAAAPAPSAPVGDLVDQLTKLAALRESGVLSDEEFATQKARLLG